MESIANLDVPRERTPRARSRFYVDLAALLIVAAIAGFWGQYYAPLLAGAPLQPFVQHWMIHVHSTVFLSWLVLFLALLEPFL